MASAALSSAGTAALLADRDEALMRRYASTSPRYTSYPATPTWTPEFGARDFTRALEHSNHTDGRGLSLYVHIPFCRKSCFSCACNRITTQDTRRAEPYLSRLDREMVLTARHLDSSRPVEQLYWGGGTPTFLTLSQMGDLIDRLDARFGLSSSPQRDYAIEIDPREADVFTLRHLQVLGFNRISLGVQDLDLDVQRAINRVQPRIMTETLMEEAHRLGFRSLNLDLTCGLPRQTVQSFAHTLEQVIELNPARLSITDYAYQPQHFASQRRINAAELPSPEARLTMLRDAAERLDQAGYVRVGMDHFARPDDSLVQAMHNGTLQRNPQGYATHADCDLLGLGASAISHIGNIQAQNPVRVKDYASALDAGELAIDRGIQPTQDDLVRREAIQQLMCHARLDLAALGQRFNIDASRYFARALSRLDAAKRDGLVEQSGDIINVMPVGRQVLNHLAGAFDAHL